MMEMTLKKIISKLIKTKKKPTKLELEVLSLQTELDRTRGKNRELNRRANGIDSHWQKRAMKAENEIKMWRESWHSDFDRMCSAHEELKEVFLECMRVKKIPFYGFHSVMDSNFLGKTKTYTDRPGDALEKTHRKVYANIFGSNTGKDNSSYIVTDVVKEIVNELVKLKKVKKNKSLAKYITDLKSVYKCHTDVEA